MAGPENIVQYREIGEVTYVRNNRAKNLTVRINPEGKIRVTIPRASGKKRAEAFLLSKKDWILRKKEEIHSTNASRWVPRTNEYIRIRGRIRRLELQGQESSPEEALWRVVLEEAKTYLPGRLVTLAGEFGYAYKGLKIRKMKSRWGSCTPANSINLNSWLVMLPPHLSDYVLLHELVHTRHKNHGRSFWKELDQLTGGKSAALRKELRSRPILSIEPGLSIDPKDVLHSEEQGTVGPV
jgi:predicted metal-dependent hydrolase